MTKSKKPAITYRMVPKRLVDLHGDSQPLSWPDGAFALDPDGDTPAIHPDAFGCMAAAAFEAAVSAALRRKLTHGQALAITVTVPGAAWSGPVTQHFASEFGDRWRLVAPTPIVAAAGADATVASLLTSGHCVACVSADQTRFPRTLVAAADIAITISPPSAAVLRAAISRFTGRAAPKDLACNADGLDLPTIVASFRPGSGPARIAHRLAGAREALKAYGLQTPESRAEEDHAPAPAHADDKEVDQC